MSTGGDQNSFQATNQGQGFMNFVPSVGRFKESEFAPSGLIRGSSSSSMAPQTNYGMLKDQHRALPCCSTHSSASSSTLGPGFGGKVNSSASTKST